VIGIAAHAHQEKTMIASMKSLRVVVNALVLLGLAATASAGDITGNVTVGGVAAKEPVVVWLEGPIKSAPPPQHAVIKQTGIRFSPTFLVVIAGQTVDMPNDDNVAHNVYSMSATKAFNLGVYEKGQTRSVRFDKPGLVDVSCWLHKRMNAKILVVPNRHFAHVVAGRYRIAGIPAGKYRLIATRRGAPSVAKQVVVRAGHPAVVDFRY
jgi:plastocyanin